MSSQYDTLAQFQGQTAPKPAPPSILQQIAALHDRLLEKSTDYQALAALVDVHFEGVVAALEKDGRTIDDYQSLTGELRGLRAARGASTVKRGRA